MTHKEKEFAVKINVDKAKNKTKVAIFLIIISISTYIHPLVWGEFDFGLIFESLSFIFLLISRIYMGKYDEIKSKIYVICSIISAGWLLIYDIILFLSVVSDIFELLLLPYSYVFAETLSLAYMYMLFGINKDLSKANNPVKYKESTDWFYEKYEEKDDKNK